jgi:hypothetical protein
MRAAVVFPSFFCNALGRRAPFGMLTHQVLAERQNIAILPESIFFEQAAAEKREFLERNAISPQ